MAPSVKTGWQTACLAIGAITAGSLGATGRVGPWSYNYVLSEDESTSSDGTRSEATQPSEKKPAETAHAPPVTVEEDAQARAQSWPWWYRVLVLKPTADNYSMVHVAKVRKDLAALTDGRASGGRVLAWGGDFGRSPEHIDVLGDKVICAVAGANGLGAAVDVGGQGRVFAKGVGSDGRVPRRMTGGRKISSVEWREGHDQAVFIDEGGNVHIADVKLVEDGEGQGGEEQNDSSTESGKSNKKVVVDRFQTIELAGHPSGLLGRIIKRRGRATKVSCGGDRCAILCHDGTVHTLETKRDDKDSSDATQRTTEIEMRVVDISHQSPYDADRPASARTPSMIDMSCSDTHLLALDGRGALYSCGEDRWMQLGQNATPWLKTKGNMRNTGVLSVAELTKARLFDGLVGGAVAAGGNHSALLVVDGTLFTCGFNQFGQLGHHNYATFAPPSPLADISVRTGSVVAGGNHTCVTTLPNGVLRCIGANESGQLGTGSLQPSTTWRKVKFRGNVLKPTFVYAGRATTVVVVTHSLEEKRAKEKEKK